MHLLAIFEPISCMVRWLRPSTGNQLQLLWEDKTMNPVVHLEMPYDDPKRMAQFYASAFGWQTQLLDEDMGNYVLATTTETDA